ncbi:uncharacterized protein [Macaca nemestrina]|uniref:uncharacterized protein n=1 Tax=Macaca nemestrina TaxID=9545 RepID=UPI0039B90362
MLRDQEPLEAGLATAGGPAPRRPRPQLHFRFLFVPWRPAGTVPAVCTPPLDPLAGPSARLFTPVPAPVPRGPLAPTLRLLATSRTPLSDLATPLLPRYLGFHFLPPGPIGTLPDTPSSTPGVSTPAGDRALSSPPLQPDPPRRPQNLSPTLSLTPPLDRFLAPASPAVDSLSRPPSCPEAMPAAASGLGSGFPGSSGLTTSFRGTLAARAPPPRPSSSETGRGRARSLVASTALPALPLPGSGRN